MNEQTKQSLINKYNEHLRIMNWDYENGVDASFNETSMTAMKRTLEIMGYKLITNEDFVALDIVTL